MKIAVIGAGLAGIEAALAARKAGAQSVTIFSREAVLPYMRPRLPEIAFGTGDVSTISIHSEAWYAEHGISLRLDMPVTSIDVGERVVQSLDGDEIFDSIVFAQGANALKPVIPGAAASPAVYTLWTADNARRISRQIHRSRSVAIVGGGIIGVETALRAQKAGLKVYLLERAPRLMAGQFDDEPADVARKILEEKGINVFTGTSLLSAEQIGSKLCMRLSTMEKSTIDVDFIILSVGARPNIALAQSAGLTADRGLCVDETLQTSCPLVYAAGGCIQYGRVARLTARSAMIQGRVAGFNAVASVKGTSSARCPSDEIPLFFKSSDLELHSWGQTKAGSVGTEMTRLDDGKKPGVVKLQVKRSDGVIVGLQMVGTGVGFDALVKEAEASRK